MAGRARFTIVLSSPTMNRLEQQIASTSIRRRRVRSGTSLPRSINTVVSDAHVNARIGPGFTASPRQVHEITARDQAGHLVVGRMSRELRPVQRRVAAAESEQVVVRTPLHHPA